MTRKTKTKPDAESVGSYIQMYLSNDNKHFVDAGRELTYKEVLSWGGRKHSEDMMPFMDPDSDYPEMDYKWPTPLFIDDTGLRSDREMLEQAAYYFYCQIVCEDLITDCDNKDPIRCYYGAVTGGGSLGRWSVTEGPTGVTFSESDDYIWVTPTEKWKDYGYTFTLGLQYLDTGGSADAWHYNPLMGKWIYILANASICTDSTSFRCCSAITSLEFDDDSTPDTMNKDSTISVYVTDNGAGPFTWTTSSYGYSLGATKTSGPSNTLTCVDGDCGTQGEGADYAPYATVTVLDSCDNTVSFVIRNVDGADWDLEHSGTNSATSFGACGEGDENCPPASDLEYIVGYERWVIDFRDDCYRSQNSNGWDGIGDHYPPCGGSRNCGKVPGSCGLYQGSTLCYCFPNHIDYYLWACTP